MKINLRFARLWKQGVSQKGGKMTNRIIKYFLSFILILCSAGCVTFTRSRDTQIQELKTQITVLEAQLEASEMEIASLKNRQASNALMPTKPLGEIDLNITPRNIQSALMNAGYDPGKIDGKLGSRTKEAVKAFQKENALKVDGKVGKETWNILKGYLYRNNK